MRILTDADTKPNGYYTTRIVFCISRRKGVARDRRNRLLNKGEQRTLFEHIHTSLKNSELAKELAMNGRPVFQVQS